MTDLVILERGVAFATSNIIAEEFDVGHNEILKKIAKLTGEILPVRFDKNFKKSTFINSRGQEYPNYKMTRDGYMFLVMNISTKRAIDKKWLFIDAFNKMEQMILRQQNQEWLTSREQGRAIRLAETDAIQEFIDYAIEQGSKGAKFYYKHFTNATYKALQLLEHKKPKTRQTLDLLQLNQLVVAESIVTKAIQSGMDNKEHYKVIFEQAKTALDGFANTLMIKE